MFTPKHITFIGKVFDVSHDGVDDDLTQEPGEDLRAQHYRLDKLAPRRQSLQTWIHRIPCYPEKPIISAKYQKVHYLSTLTAVHTISNQSLTICLQALVALITCATLFLSYQHEKL